jgi:hypothetical protein
MAPWGFRDFYRRGSYCVLSFEAVSQLRNGGDEQPCEHASAIVGLAQEQLDVVFYGHRYECVQRIVVRSARRQRFPHQFGVARNDWVAS